MEIKHNPWSGGNISDFLFYNCPECDVKEKDPDTFLGHALQNHKRARISLNGKYEEPENLLNEHVDLSDDKTNLNCDQENASVDREDLDNNEGAFSDENQIDFKGNKIPSEKNHVAVKREYEKVMINEEINDQPVVKRLRLDIKSQCYYCGTVLFGEDATDLTESMLAHISDKHNMFVTPKMYGKMRDYQCNDCLRMFNTRDSLDIHVCGVVPSSWLGPDQKSQQCTKCDESFEDYGQLLCHFKENHSAQVKYKCCNDHCSITFTSRSELSDHVKQKHTHQCRYCYKFIHREKALYRHNLTCNGNGLPLYYANECLFCCMRFDTKHSLEQHKETIHGKVIETLKYKCLYCDFVATTKWLRKDHKKREHQQVCPICFKDFGTSPSALKQHMITHTDTKNFLCEQCDFRCKTIHDLEKHKKRVHDKVHNHFCETCGKGFYDFTNLTDHVERNHGSENKYKCRKCDEDFKTNQHRKNHIKKIHEKFAICTRCDKMFIDGFAKLRNHLKKDHQSYNKKIDELWLCPKCDKRFELTKDLNEHLQQEHSMTKDHFCSKCNDAFVTKSVLTNHQCEVHNFDPTKETEENSAFLVDTKKVVKDIIDRQFKCELCNIYLKSSRTLDAHNKQAHQKESHSHFCSECDWSTYEATRLKKHCLESHAEKHWKCKQCNHLAASQTLLTNHIRRAHDKAFYVSCSECDQKFSAKYLLAKHYMNDHQILMATKQVHKRN